MSKLKKISLVIALFAFSANLVEGQSVTRFDFTYNTGQLQAADMLSKARELVWKGWTEKRRVKVQFRHHGIDSPPNVTTLKVSRNKRGMWCVKMRYTERKVWVFWSESRVIESGVYCDVDRVEVVTQLSAPEIPMTLSRDVERDPQNYRLRLKNATAKDDFVF